MSDDPSFPRWVMQLVSGLERLEAGQERLRSDVMGRIDRLQDLVTALRAERRAVMLVEVTRADGKKIAVNAAAVAWVVEAEPWTIIAISGKQGDAFKVKESYNDVVTALREVFDE